MKTFLGSMTSRIFALLAALILTFAQGGAQAQSEYVFSQQELDQMLAPIALYPDALLSQVLMASTYPLEVVEAARWSRARPGLSGDDAVRAAEGENWDPSVKSLVAFPQLLERMGENLQWTQALGDAFLDQQAQVMDTVQVLRRRAEAAGTLRSDDRLRVLDSSAGLMVELLDPQVIYVPYYDPLVVYGSWWWPTYPPFHWRPWAGYYARPGYAPGFYWGPPIGISAGFFFGAFDWPRRQVRVMQVNNYYYSHSVANRAVIENRTPGAWHHEPEHRRGIAYRDIEARQRFGAARLPQIQGDRAMPAEPRRSDQRIEVRPTAPHAPRPEARPEGRRPDARSPAETRATVQPAPTAHPAPALQPTPVMQAAPASRANRQQPAAAQPAPTVQPAPRDARVEHRREMRGTPQSAQPARPAPVMQSAPAARPAPAAQPAPVVQPAPTAPPAPAARGNRPTERRVPGARQEAPQAGGAAADARPAQPAMRQDSGADFMGRPRTGR
jgi:hypothetical protein